MFYIIYIAVIVFALYLIFHDRFGEEGQMKSRSSSQPGSEFHPESTTPVPLTPPEIPAMRATMSHGLSWSYLDLLEYNGRLVGDVIETEVTGMRHYCTLADLGPVNGVVEPEPENPHDPQAMVVIRADGKKLGYIARNNLPQYQNFNPYNAVCPFAGHVRVTRQGYLWAEILVALPKDRVFVLRELSNYVDSKQIHE